MNMQPKWGSVRSLWPLYRINPNKAYELIKQGRLRAKKDGRLTIVEYASADEHMDSLPDFEAPEKSAA